MWSIFLGLLYKCCEMNVAWSRSDLIWNNKFNAKRVSCIRVTIAENGISVSSCAADITAVYHIRVLNVALFVSYLYLIRSLKKTYFGTERCHPGHFVVSPSHGNSLLINDMKLFKLKNTVGPSHQEKTNPKYSAWEYVFCWSTFSTLGKGFQEW